MNASVKILLIDSWPAVFGSQKKEFPGYVLNLIFCSFYECQVSPFLTVKDLQDLLTAAKLNLNRFWRFDDFRDGQDEAVKSVFEGKDTLVLFPTGGGKSLCFQIPATVLNGLTLVISPLIALMQDQVQQLSDRGISATFINSTIPNYEVEQRLVNARNGMYKLLYCAPERLSSPLFQSELLQLNIQLVAIDEAHCISEWGHEFRPAYRHIRPALASLGNHVRWVALTATATPEVKDDILKNLAFHQPNIISKGFGRPNLKWWVIETDKKREKLISSVKKAAEQGDGLVYGGTRKNCEELAGKFLQMGIKAEAYHAGIEPGKRKIIQEQWISGETPLVVATNAFGMGIDKPDCRYVIHEEMPYSLEAYYQEAGRAGRDGKESFPILFYRKSDYMVAQKRINDNYTTREELELVYRALADSLHLAVGSEMDKSEPFSMESVRKRAGLPLNKCRAGIRLLDQFGIIAIQEGVPPAVSLQFTMSAELLAKFKSKTNNSEKAEFIDKLERLFGHFAYSDMVNVDLDTVLGKLNIRRNVLIKALNVLMQNDQFLVFTIIDERNLVRFLEARSQKLRLSKTEVESYRDHLLEKLKLMNGFATTNACREVYLRTYFGEVGAKPCGHCDNCLRSKSTEEPVTSDDVKTAFGLLIEQNVSATDVLKLTGWSRAKFSKAIRYLIKEEMITTDPKRPGYYFLNGKESLR